MGSLPRVFPVNKAHEYLSNSEALKFGINGFSELDGTGRRVESACRDPGMKGAAESLIPLHAPVITHLWPGSSPLRTYRVRAHRDKPGQRLLNGAPAKHLWGREGGRRGWSRPASTAEGSVNKLQGGDHSWEVWATKRSTSAGAMEEMPLPGVPQQGVWEQLCLLQLFKHSACLYSHLSFIIFVYMGHAHSCIHLHINLPLPVS